MGEQLRLHHVAQLLLRAQVGKEERREDLAQEEGGRALLDAERDSAPELDSEFYRGLGLIGARVLDGVSQMA